MRNRRRLPRLRMILLLFGCTVFQAVTCTQEQVQQQIEHGLTAAFNLATVEVAGQVLDIDTGP